MTHSATRAQGIAFDPPEAALAGPGPQAFFLLAALYGALVLVLWVVVFRLQSVEVVPPIMWCAHEMIYGFAATSAAGLLIALVVSLGAISRIAQLVPGASIALVIASGAVWTFAFAVFLAAYLPILIEPHASHS